MLKILEFRTISETLDLYKEKKEEILLSPMTKADTPTEKIQNASWQHEKRHLKLRLHYDSWQT